MEYREYGTISLDYLEHSALDLAIRNGTLTSIRELLAHEDVTQETQGFLTTPLHEIWTNTHLLDDPNGQYGSALGPEHGTDAGVLDKDNELPLLVSDEQASDLGREQRQQQLREARHEVATLLVELGADVNKRAKRGRTPLFFAVDSGPAACAFLLQHGAKADEMDCMGSTLLHICLEEKRGKSSQTATDHSQAVKNERDVEDMMQMLLDHGADPNASDWESRTPLHLAVENGTSRNVKMLLDRGAVLDLDCLDDSNAHPIHILCQRLSDSFIEGDCGLSILRLLIAASSEPIINLDSCIWWTPLARAIFCENWTLADALIDLGATLDTADAITVLSIVIFDGRHKVVERLIKLGADPNHYALGDALYQSLEGRRHSADLRLRLRDLAERGLCQSTESQIDNGHKQAIADHDCIFKLLIEAGADVNKVHSMDDLMTPLHLLAVEGGPLEAATLLLEHGARTDLKDEDGKTALEWAVEKERHELAALIKGYVNKST